MWMGLVCFTNVQKTLRNIRLGLVHFRFRSGMVQPCEPLWCMLGSHGVKAQQCKDNLHWTAGLFMRPKTELGRAVAFLRPRGAFRELKQTPAIRSKARGGDLLRYLSGRPSQSLACSLSHPMPSFREMIQREVWARGCSQSAAQPWLPCCRGKRRGQAHGGELCPDRWPQGYRTALVSHTVLLLLYVFLLILACPKIKCTFQD